MPIEKLPSGRYRVRVTSGRRPDGKPRRISRTLPAGAGLDEAKRVELELRLHAGHSTAEGDMTALSDLVRVWIANGDDVRAATTQYSYRSVVAQWLDGSSLGATPVARVRTAEIDAHYFRILTLKPEGERPPGTVGPATVKRLHAILSGALKWATRMGWIAQNPAANCSPIPDVRPKLEATDPAEFRAALEVAEDRHVGLRALILFIGTTGCRKSDALALQRNPSMPYRRKIENTKETALRGGRRGASVRSSLGECPLESSGGAG